ncbi:MAG: RNA polymerase sigma factor (sigma-70 family) [Glaciecola sp.]|jgi:RNA polymerase sigma factor (sigma-70 family)
MGLTAQQGIGVDRRRAAVRPVGVEWSCVLAAARNGEAWAWEGLYTELAPVVLGYLRGQRAPTPEDLLGEVMLQVVRDLAAFTGTEPQFRSWVFTIAHHRLLDARRYERRRPVDTLSGNDLASCAPAALEVTEDQALESLTTEEIRLLFKVLTADQRTALLLRVVAGMTIGEVAEIMDKRVGAVKQLQRRGIHALREHLHGSPYPFREGWALTEAT